MDECHGLHRCRVSRESGQMFALIVPQMDFGVVTSDDDGVSHRGTSGDPIVVNQSVFGRRRMELLDIFDLDDRLQERFIFLV